MARHGGGRGVNLYQEGTVFELTIQTSQGEHGLGVADSGTLVQAGVGGIDVALCSTVSIVCDARCSV